MRMRLPWTLRCVRGRMVSEDDKGGSHEGHADDNAYERQMVVAETFGAWQEFVEGDVDHDAGDNCEADGVDHRRPEGEEEKHPDQGSGGFGEA